MMCYRTLVWGLLWFCLLGPVLQAALGQGLTTPYDEIVSSNVFRLKAPEARPVEPPPQALASIKLTGITTLLAHKLALFQVRLPGNSAAPELALSLQEGQRERDIEVLSIDEKAGRVELLNFGTRMVASFEADSPSQSGLQKAVVRSPLRRLPTRFANQ